MSARLISAVSYEPLNGKHRQHRAVMVCECVSLEGERGPEVEPWLWDCVLNDGKRVAVYPGSRLVYTRTKQGYRLLGTGVSVRISRRA